MKKYLFILSGAIVAFTASAVINGAKAADAPTDLYVDPGTHSCVVRWNDDNNDAWNLRYRLFSEEPEEPVLLHSLSGSNYTGSYADVTLPDPWGGVNTRAGNGAIYVKNNYNGVARGTLTYTIPEGYDDATFTLLITSGTGDYGAGNFTVYTPQTPDVGHTFTGGETYRWLVTASSGEQITVYSTDTNYSPDIALIEVYSGDATGAKLASGVKAYEWNYVYNLTKTTYTIEDLEMETDYEVQVQAIGEDGSLSDWTRPDVFTTLDEEPIIPAVNIMGEIDDQAWAPDAGTKMEYYPEDEIYVVSFFIEKERSFGFSTELDINNDMGGWNYLLPYRFGPECEGGLFELTDEYLGQPLPLSWDNWGNIQVSRTAEYTVTVSLEKRYIIINKIEGTEPEEWELGDVNHSHSVDVDDITMLINVVLGNDIEGYYPEQANCDNDAYGTIDVDDITALLNRILSGHW